MSILKVFPFFHSPPHHLNPILAKTHAKSSIQLYHVDIFRILLQQKGSPHEPLEDFSFNETEEDPPTHSFKYSQAFG